MDLPNGKLLIHLGRFDTEEPHKSFERVEKFKALHPDTRVVCVVWTKEDKDALAALPSASLYDTVLWDTDGALMGWLMQSLATLVGARIVWPQWYRCPDGHITAVDYVKVPDKCSHEGCTGPIANVAPEDDRRKRFVEMFMNVVQLAGFDTTSGQFLHAQVSPIQNLLRNIPAAVGCEHAQALQCADLKGPHKGKAAIICGAGPSLEKAIPHLARLSETHAIICVGRAFRMLRAKGVKVGYTISVEMFDWDSAIFDGISREEAGDTVMLYASVCAPSTVKAWPGKKACLWDVETAKMLGRDDFIYGGNSVAHHMLNFAAQILDAEPIILCGIDLAYTQPKTHADGTNPDKWPDSVKAEDTAYQQELWVPCTGKGEDFHPECHRTPAALGGGGLAMPKVIEVRSSPSYKHFATLFEILISQHGKRVLNACPNGQRIGGTAYVDLSTL